MSDYINLTEENLEREHLCCAIADQKHQAGVRAKRAWLAGQLPKGHVFRRLNEKGKVFIEYSPLEAAWVPVVGEHYLYIHCLWVSGSFKGKGHAKALLEHCIDDARQQRKSGVCVLSSKKKIPFLSDKKFMQKYGFQTVDTIAGDYELLALSFDGTTPRFADSAKQQRIDHRGLTLYYSPQCPYIPNCVEQAKEFSETNGIPLRLIAVDSLETAKSLPCVFNNWAVFINGIFVTVSCKTKGA